MPTDNPNESAPPTTRDPDSSPPEEIAPGHAAYNIVSDTVTGLNLRKSDNLFQAKCIVGSVILSAIVGAILAAMSGSQGMPWYGGAMLGGLAGVVIGLFGSGIYLMIYRAARHLQGKHK